MNRTINVVFVCHGNICRSPMAEFVFKDIINKKEKSEKYKVTSFATSFEEIGNDVYPNAKEVLRKNNIPFSRREATRIKKEDYNNADIVLVMDNYNYSNLARIVNDDKKIRLLGEFAHLREISDPWYTRQFDQCFREIKQSCEKLFEYLEEKYA